MPTYDYECQKCDKPFEIVQSIKEYDGKGECPTCGNVSTDRIFSHQVYFVGASVQNAEYNPAFGQVVKNKNHRNELAKQRGMVEIGNESPTKMHATEIKDREAKLKKSWDEV